MRFFFLTITLFLQALNLVALPADAKKLSPEQITLIENKGTAGIQRIFNELKIEIEDLPSVEAFALKTTSSLLTPFSTPETIYEIAFSMTVALAEIAASENTIPSYVVEYAAAGIAQGLIITSQDINLEVLPAIENASEGVANGAIQFSINSGADVDKIICAAASGYLAGTIEASKSVGNDIIAAVEISTNGLIIGTINHTLVNNIEIYQTLSSTCEGIAEAAIEASVREQLDLIKQITAASVGAGKSAVESATALSLEVNRTQKAILEGLSRGTAETIPGKGTNVRIMIKPVKDENVLELIKALESAIINGGMQADYFPIIETPFEDDPMIRQVSPIN